MIHSLYITENLYNFNGLDHALSRGSNSKAFDNILDIDRKSGKEDFNKTMFTLLNIIIAAPTNISGYGNFSRIIAY